MAMLSTFLINIVTIVIIIFINALALWFTAQKLLSADRDSAKKGFKTALSVSFVAGAVSFVLSLFPTFNPVLVGNALLNLLFFVINAAVLLWLIRKFYELSWGKSTLAWLVVTIVGFVLGFILGGIVGFIIPG